MVEELYRAIVADMKKQIKLLGNSPYYQGLPGWRLYEERLRKDLLKWIQDGVVGMEMMGNGPCYEGLPGWKVYEERLRKELHKWTQDGGVGTVVVGRKDCSWAEKYRPIHLEDFICHKDKADVLRLLVADGVRSHFIFEGPPGVGKKTLIWAFLREAFGSETSKTREEVKEFELKGEEIQSIEVKVKLSPRHVEIDLSEFRGYEKHIITTLIEETHNVAAECDSTNSRAIVLYKADELCMDTQNYIRWIMGRHKGCHKVIFSCSNVTNLQSIGTICTTIRLLPPSNDEIVRVLGHIAEKEGIEMYLHLAETTAKSSKKNLQQAIQSFETSSQLKHNTDGLIPV